MTAAHEGHRDIRHRVADDGDPGIRSWGEIRGSTRIKSGSEEECVSCTAIWLVNDGY